MTLEEAIKRAKALADFNRRLAGQYETTCTVKPDEKTRKAADTYAERAMALDTVIAAANGDMTAEYTPKQTGRWMQSRYLRSVFACSVCRRSCDVTFNGTRQALCLLPELRREDERGGQTMKTFETLPVKHANRFEMDAFYKLSAMRNTLGMAKEDLESRARMIPGGWRDLCACSALTGKLVNHMLLTFEPQKRPYIVRQMENSRIRVLFAREASHDPETVIMDVEDLAVLTYYGYEHCKVCMGNPDECSRCQLGKVLDKCSFESRGNRSWWEVINGAVKEEGEP